MSFCMQNWKYRILSLTNLFREQIRNKKRSCMSLRFSRSYLGLLKDQLPIQSIQYQLSGTLRLSPVTTRPTATITTFKAHLRTELFSRPNISSAAGASDSNSRHTAPPINVFDIWHLTVINRFKRKSAFDACQLFSRKLCLWLNDKSYSKSLWRRE